MPSDIKNTNPGQPKDDRGSLYRFHPSFTVANKIEISLVTRKKTHCLMRNKKILLIVFPASKFCLDRVLDGKATAFVSADQDTRDLIPIFCSQLVGATETLPNEDLEEHRRNLERLPLVINSGTIFWSREIFRSFWKQLKKEGIDTMILDHLTAIQGQYFLYHLALINFLKHQS